MIGEMKPMTTKSDLVRAIQALDRFDYEVVEVRSSIDKSRLTASLDRMLRRGPVSVVFIRVP